MNKKTIYLLISAVMALFIGGFFLVGDFEKGSNSSGMVPVAAASMVDMNGTWTQTASGFTTITMTATISDGEISIDEQDGSNLSGLYWKGTFPVSTILSDGFSVTSAGDTDAMNASLLASLDKTKTFSYKDGDLTFSFSMVGMTTTVHLQRSSE